MDFAIANAKPIWKPQWKMQRRSKDGAEDNYSSALFANDNLFTIYFSCYLQL
jgi:hypothetical protein